jgi:thymidine kinase
MENQTNCGYLEVILGPMFSGKTSKLIDIYKQYQYCSIPVLVINHSADVRYSNTTMNTHDNASVPCVFSAKLLDVITENINLFTANGSVAVLINEGQFFPDLYNAVYEMVNIYKAHVYVAGLDGDYRRQKFGQMLDLIPISNTVYKLNSLCAMCKNGTKAIFSYRIDVQKKEQVQIGSSEYLPLCRQCYSVKSLGTT